MCPHTPSTIVPPQKAFWPKNTHTSPHGPCRDGKPCLACTLSVICAAQAPWALLLRAYLSQIWPAWLQDLQSQDAHDNIGDPSPADTMDRSLGQWVFNRVEWEWNPGKKLAPDGPVICWRIPYPVVSDHEPSTACLRAWYWEIAERVQKVVFPRANQARRTETETHLTHWFWRVQWYPVYPPPVTAHPD